MNVGHGADYPGAELERLRRKYPRRQGPVLAGHPAVRDLISSTDIAELARRLAEAEGWAGR